MFKNIGPYNFEVLEFSGGPVGFKKVGEASRIPWCRVMSKTSPKVNEKESNDYFDVSVAVYGPKSQGA